MRSIKLTTVLRTSLGLLESSLSLLPFGIKRGLATFNYYKINNKYLKDLTFHVFNYLLKDCKEDIYVNRKYIIIDGKRVNYNLRLNLRSFVNRLFYYKDVNTNLGYLMMKFLDKDEIYVDVGANIGQTSFMGSCFTKEVIAFEPVPEMVSFFKNSMKVNPSKNVKLYEFALSNDNEIKKISVSDGKDGIHTLNPEFEKFIQNKYDRSIEIETKRFDDLNLKNVSMIKIDVEGHELQVLEGMKNSIKNIKYVMCETSPPYYKKVLSYFDDKGFEQIKEYGDYNVGMINLFFVNKEKVTNLENVRLVVSKMPK